MQIVVRQISGLGNQLFQYAAGRYYTREHGAEMRVAVEPARVALSYGYPRPFSLSHFAIQAPWAYPTRRDRFFVSGRRSIRIVSVPLKRALGVEEFTEPMEQRYRFLPKLPLGSRARTVYLRGYWQTHRMVDAVADELRTEFQCKEAPQGKTEEVLRQIRNSVQPVSLHIRRGDYTLAAESMSPLPIDYYTRAIAIMQAKFGEPTFFVFSDDIAFAKVNLPSGIRKIFVDHNDAFSAHEDLRLMSCCRHHIIANSTFSWWGAWMNSAPGKVVVAPRHWLLREDSYYPDLFSPDWTLLNTVVEQTF